MGRTRHKSLSFFLVLLDGFNEGDAKRPSTLAWSGVRAVGELKTSERWEEAHLSLADKIYFLCSQQDDRCFSFGLSFCSSKLRVTCFDRGRSQTSSIIDIHKDPLLFLQVIVPLSCGAYDLLGYDITNTCISHHTPIAPSRTVYVEDELYTIKGNIYISNSVHGQGTSVFLAKHTLPSGEEEDVVIKDYWCDEGCTFVVMENGQPVMENGQPVKKLNTKGEVLRRLEEEGVPHTPRLVKEAIVKRRSIHKPTEWVEDRTSAYRPANADKFEPRVHFLSALIDCVKAHSKAWLAGILHRDISQYNLFLVHNQEREQKGQAREGEAGDWDFSSWDLVELISSALHRTGTLPWMSLELLIACVHDILLHCPFHDIESFCSVIIYSAINQIGPYGLARTWTDQELKDDLIPLWVKPGMRHMSDYNFSIAKLLHLTSPQGWAQHLALVTDFCQDLKPCMQHVWELAFKPLIVTHSAEGSVVVMRDGPNPTHEDLLAILTQELAKLPPPSAITDEQFEEHESRCFWISISSPGTGEGEAGGTTPKVLDAPGVASCQSSSRRAKSQQRPGVLRRDTKGKRPSGQGETSSRKKPKN
ncbi:hypothetical protein BJ138DRAFT_1120249 [Hygrophoropsis aurantiaca]|uniref:Uncharacterized protein n=1 Tax=Hygrophoropsis aurantiaca TaxID=72124 RepID=A0ACB7ZR52_9AGAM|nr:hypothetical protein BJ138DRAFT_1120249 [Hygrophoropsis aurantiaca]